MLLGCFQIRNKDARKKQNKTTPTKTITVLLFARQTDNNIMGGQEAAFLCSHNLKRGLDL